MKKIVRPELTDAVRLTAREMNDIRFSSKHTVLTPEQLEKITAETIVPDNTPPSSGTPD